MMTASSKMLDVGRSINDTNQMGVLEACTELDSLIQAVFSE